MSGWKASVILRKKGGDIQSLEQTVGLNEMNAAAIRDALIVQARRLTR